MASVRYKGNHPEPSITMRIPTADSLEPVQPWDVAGEGDSRRNEVFAFPSGLWRPVSPFVAAYLRAIRRRHGPWFDVKLTREEWAEVRRRAPWIRRPSDAARLVDPGVTESFLALEVRPFTVA